MQTICQTPTHVIQEHWTAVLSLLGLISSVYHNLHPWRSNQWPQIAVPKLYNLATNSYRKQVTPNQLVMVNAWPTNINVSCKLHPYSFQRTWSPPGPCLPKKLRNTAVCGCWFDLQWLRLRYTLLMRPNKVKTAVQCSCISCVGVQWIFWSW